MVKPKISFEVRNTAVMDRLLKEMPKLRKSYVTVGFFEGKTYEDGTDVVEVAMWNEFGTKNTPQRSFIRSTIEENSDKINRWREEALVEIVEKGATAKKALDGLGEKIVILIQNKIKSNVPPPNAPSTMAAKKRENSTNWGRTLMDTETMLNSVTFRTVTP